MFRWIKRLLKRFGLRKEESQILQGEEIIQPQIPTEPEITVFNHEPEKPFESTNNDGIIEEKLEETIDASNEADYSELLSELIKEYSDNKTSDELSTIEHLVDTLHPSDHSSKEYAGDIFITSSEHIQSLNIEKAEPLNSTSVHQEQIKISSETTAFSENIQSEKIPSSNPSSENIAVKEERCAIVNPITENEQSEVSDAQEVISYGEDESTEDKNDQADSTEVVEATDLLAKENEYNPKVLQDADQTIKEQPQINESEISVTSDDIQLNADAAIRPINESQEIDADVSIDEITEEFKNTVSDLTSDTEEPDTSDDHEEAVMKESAETLAHEEEIQESADRIYEPKNTLQIIESNSGITEDGVVSSNTIRINVDEISTDYEELNLDASDFDHLMESLCFKIRSNKLIGYDLLQIINNEEVIHRIHANAEHYLLENYNRSSANTYTHKEDIIVSLILIALFHYDGSLWDYVRSTYRNLYFVKSEQKTDRMIRQILAEYITEDTRYINFVIRQAIIPYKYLYDFITFAFDIYKGTLRYEIPVKIDYILANIYIDVSNMYESDSEQLQTDVKTYKLIKTTKDIIDNVQWFGELIAYTHLVLSYIDLHYWEDNKKPLPYSEYFNPVLEKWIENNRSLFYEERDYKSRERSSWSASFSIDQTDIILHIANCIIRKENDPSKININVINDGFSFSIIRPKVTEEIGGYLVHGTDIKVANPLGGLEYQICCDNTVLYSTKEKLYREYLLFNENHSEVKNTSQYYGNLDIVTFKKNSHDLDVYYSDPKYDYVIAQKYVDPFDSIRIGNDTLFFYTEEKTSLNAVKVDGVKINSKHHEFNLYKQINYLSLITTEPPENLALQINRQNYHWKDWLVKQSNTGYLYKINLADYIVDGFNEINIVNWKNDNQIVFTDRLFYDPDFLHSFQPDTERKIRMNITCNLISEASITSDMNAENVFDIAFDHPVFSSTLHMIVTPGIPVYRIDKRPWRLFDGYISAKNLTNPYSRIYFDGITPDSVKLLSKDPERVLNDLLIQNIAGKSFVTIEKLLSVPNSISVASLAFYKDGIAKETIDVFYRAVFDRNSLETDYDEETKEGIIRFNVLGNDQIHVSVFSKNKLCYRNENETMPAEIRIPNIDSFEKYNISITGGKESLFELNNSKQYEILSQSISFYNVADIIKRSFTIHSCRLHYTLIETDEGRDYIVHPHQSEIEVLRKLSSDKYEVSVKQIMGGNEKSFIAEMEMTSSITSGDFWCSIKSEDKWLKYNAPKSTPTNILNNTYMDILEYHVYYKKPGKSKKPILYNSHSESRKNTIVAVLPFSEEQYSKCLSILNKGKPVPIGVYLYGTAETQAIIDSINGDVLIVKVNDKYYECSLEGEKFRIITQSRNGSTRLRINAKWVYGFIPTEAIDDLAIDSLDQEYDLLNKGNVAGKKNEFGYIYTRKQ